MADRPISLLIICLQMYGKRSSECRMKKENKQKERSSSGKAKEPITVKKRKKSRPLNDSEEEEPIPVIPIPVKQLKKRDTAKEKENMQKGKRLVVGDYCQNEDKPSIPFCQNGTISGLKVYINGSSVKTTVDLKDRGCVCYFEQNKNMEIIVDAKESCLFCGLKVGVGNSYLTSNYDGSEYHGWGSIVLTDTKFTMTLGVDGTPDSLNTAFCIGIQENKPDNPVVLTLTCKELVMINKMSSAASSLSPNVTTTSPNMVQNTTKSQSTTSAVTTQPLAKTETTRIAEVSTGDTNVTQYPKATNPSTAATIATTTNCPREFRFSAQNDEIVVAAAAGGFGVGVVFVIVIDVIIVICYKRRIKNKDTHSLSAAPSRVYTELDFSSRGGQNDNHVYNSIERQSTYANDVQR